jgi:hypothetical protein
VKFLRMSLGVLLLVILNGCITQEDTHFGDSKTEPMWRELTKQEFADLINNIVVEKVNPDMFLVLSGRSLHMRNTYDHEGKKIRVSIIKNMNEIYISVDPGHFTSMPPVPDFADEPYSLELIDVRGLFTPQIEIQGDLIPPPDFVIRRTYDIVIMNHEGTLTVCRGHVSVYLIIGPIPAVPAPDFTIYYIAGVILALVVFSLVIIVKKRNILKKGGFHEQ